MALSEAEDKVTYDIMVTLLLIFKFLLFHDKLFHNGYFINLSSSNTHFVSWFIKNTSLLLWKQALGCITYLLADHTSEHFLPIQIKLSCTQTFNRPRSLTKFPTGALAKRTTISSSGKVTPTVLNSLPFYWLTSISFTTLRNILRAQ